MTLKDKQLNRFEICTLRVTNKNQSENESGVRSSKPNSYSDYLNFILVRRHKLLKRGYTSSCTTIKLLKEAA